MQQRGCYHRAVKSSFETVIVGGGVMGASAAWHLAARGQRDILVLDREPRPGLGSTGRATGGYRAQFSSEINIRLSLLAREKLLRFAEEVGGDPGYRPYGYLFLAADRDQLEALAKLRVAQHAAGLHESREVGLEEIHRINPAVSLDGLAGGAWCPTDGFIRPLEILDGYRAAAERQGVHFSWDEPCVSFELEPSASPRIAAVRTSRNRYAARTVINAAGAWAAEIGKLAGIEIPVKPVRRHVAVTEPFAGLPETMPLTVWIADGFHLRVRDGRVLLLRPRDHPSDLNGDDRFDPSWLDGLHQLASRFVPALAAARIDVANSWAGLYEMSPDKHALLGPAPGVDNLWLINGSSGHGVMHAGPLGQLLSEMLLDGAAHTLDVSALDPGRFLAGKPNPDASYL